MNIVYTLGAIANVPYEVSQWLEPLLMILMAVIGICGIVFVLMQKGTNDNIGSLGGDEKTDTYADKNKSRSRESVLKKLTAVCFVLMLVLAVVFFIVKR